MRTTSPLSFCVLVLPVLVALLSLAGCGGSAPPASLSASQPEATGTVAPDQPAPTGQAAPAEQVAPADDAAALAAKQQELERREAELALRERELAVERRETELAAQQNAPKKSAAPPGATAPAKPKATTTVAAAAATRPPPRVTIPAGTDLPIQLAEGLSTATAKEGDRFEGRLASDVMVGNRRALAAGASVRGTVTKSYSGSQNIGGTPTLGLTLDQVVTRADRVVPVSATYLQEGKKESGKDAAKIAGGTAAGAVIGHQISSGKGKVIGGIIGGVAGTVAASKTGGNVELPASTVAAFRLNTAIEVEAP